MATFDDSHLQLPDQQTIEGAGKLTIKDENGKDVPFSSLYTDQSENDRTLIVFIRHFFCGACELYVQNLTSQLQPSPNFKLAFIGCGGHKLVADYRKRNNISYPVYADPSRTLFKKLGFRETSSPLSEGWKARESEYHNKSFLSVVASSAWNMLGSGPSKAVSAGPPGQNGGAILLQGKEAKFIHRMRDVGDYLNPKEAKVVLGVEE